MQRSNKSVIFQVLKSDDFTIVLVDTEGIDAASADKKNDISLLVLTILLSSYFVFNTISVPKQAQLEDLEWVGECFKLCARTGSHSIKPFLT